jgi:hypothetical protein
MQTEEILTELRNKVAQAEHIIKTATEERDRITIAIRALTGAPQKPAGLSVPDMILAAAETLGRDKVFDHKAIIHQADQQFPGKHEMIKRGVYTAINYLIKKQKLQRVPHGFQLL